MKTSSDLQERFDRHCLNRRFFSPRDRVLIAVSGGVDSMVLLHLMQSLARQMDVTIAVGHVHHGLRGAPAQRDRDFVKRFCRSNKIRFHSCNVLTKKHAKAHGLSIEEAARQLRYRALRRWAAQGHYKTICTAHHRSDQAETVLMRVLKGTGFRGLSGIREKTQDLIRPLLPFSRQEIRNYALANGIPYRDDSTNRNARFLRNRLRTDILPSIRRHVDPQADRHLTDLARISEDTHHYLRMQAEREFTRIGTVSSQTITLAIERHQGYFFALFAALFELIFEKLAPDRILLNMTDIESLHRLYTDSETGRRLMIGPVMCVKDRDRIVFTVKRARPLLTKAKRILRGETYRWNDFMFSSQDVRVTTFDNNKGRSPLAEYIDASSVKGRLVVRPWKRADRFYPIGLGGSKRVSDLLTELKVSVLDRPRIRVLTEQSRGAERIIWVCGYRLDDRFKVTDQTTVILECQCNYEKND